MWVNRPLIIVSSDNNSPTSPAVHIPVHFSSASLTKPAFLVSVSKQSQLQQHAVDVRRSILLRV